MIVEEKNRKEEKAALVNTLRSDDAKILQQMSQVNHSERSFLLFRTQYLVVFAAIMLADGLQGETQNIPRLIINQHHHDHPIMIIVFVI